MILEYENLPEMELVSLVDMAKDTNLTCNRYDEMVEGMIIVLNGKKNEEFLSIVKEFEHHKDVTLATLVISPLIRNKFNPKDITSVTIWGKVDLNE